METSLESIMFQGKHNPLVNELIERFTRCINLYKEGTYDPMVDEMDNITHAILQRIGINCTLKMKEVDLLSKLFFSPYSAYMDMEGINAVSLLHPKMTEAFSKGDLNTFNPMQLLNGRIDYKQCKVDGVFSKIKFNFTFTTMMFDGRLDGEELTAVLMHELSHCWDFLTMIGQGVVTSALCVGIADFFNRHDSEDVKLKFGTMVIKNIDPKAKDVNPTADELMGVVVRSVNDRFEKTTGLKWKADETGEYLADQFASRWGLGVSLVKVLSKLEHRNSLSGKIGLGGAWTGVFGAIMTFVMSPWKMLIDPQIKLSLPMIPIKYKLMVAGINIPLYLITIILTEFVTQAVVDFIYPYGKHPSLQNRILAVRRDQISILQNKDLTPEERKGILADIDAIDSTYGEVKDWDNKFTTLTYELTNLITGKRRELNLKRDIADRTNNRLYELSARLEALK